MSLDEYRLDLRIGEARLIRDITTRLFELSRVVLDVGNSDWEYRTNGYRSLVRFLEDKYGAPVIITNGANQALHAVMYALKTKGFVNLGIRTPYWNRIPNIAKYIGLQCTPFDGNILAEKSIDLDSYLLTLPNNPDGYLPSLDELRTSVKALKDLKIPLIHDAVYYTRSYLPIDYPIESVGDLQIFSASKHFGLSALRVGYIVIHDESFIKPLNDFMEFSTVGVSVVAQQLFLHILERELNVPFIRDTFYRSSREQLKQARRIFKNLKPEYVEIPEKFEHGCGVFAWVKPKIDNLFEKANIDVLPGSLFGQPGFVRINLAAGNTIIAEMVRRVNAVTHV